MSDVHIRAAEPGDQVAIWRLIYEGRINPMGLHWPNFLVAQASDGRIVGCGQIKAHKDGSRELASIAVTAAYRGNGLAAAIIRELLRREQGTLYLYCAPRLRTFYPRFGFAEVDVADLPSLLRRTLRFGQALVAPFAALMGTELGPIAMRRD